MTLIYQCHPSSIKKAKSLFLPRIPDLEQVEVTFENLVGCKVWNLSFSQKLASNFENNHPSTSMKLIFTIQNNNKLMKIMCNKIKFKTKKN